MKWILNVALLFLGGGCSFGGDYTKELSGGYFYRSEGQGLHDILSHTSEGREIPADVISYDYNDSLIVAVQKPNRMDDPLYDQKAVYKQGRNVVYFWLVYHSQKLVMGPLTHAEYKSARKKFGVPEDVEVDFKK